MSDCPNAEIRDSLPDLVNGRLDGATTSAVQAHIACCADCQAEVALIESARAAIIMATPRVDTERIVRSLPAARVPSTYRRWSEWSVAAAILVIALGGVGLYSRSEVQNAHRVRDSLSAAIASTSSASPAADTSAELSVPGDLNRLTDDQLRELVDKVGKMDALPSIESRRVSIPIGNASTPNGADSADSTGAT